MKTSTILVAGPVAIEPHVEVASLLRTQVLQEMREEFHGETEKIPTELLQRRCEERARTREGYLVLETVNTLDVHAGDILSEQHVRDLIDNSPHLVKTRRPGKDLDYYVCSNEREFMRLPRLRT